jgi:hypothetical protein
VKTAVKKAKVVAKAQKKRVVAAAKKTVKAKKPVAGKKRK